MRNIKATLPTPYLLHILPRLRLLLLLRDPQLLEEDICGIENGAGISGVGTLLSTEVTQLFRVDLPVFGVVLRCQVPEELCLGDAGSAQVCVDLLADLIA